MHCAREDFGWHCNRYEVRDGRIFCDDFVVFPYLYDVHPGDGGLLVVPGTHKTFFDRPGHLYNDGKIKDTDDIPEGVVNITPKAGDFVIISELLTHGALPLETEGSVSLRPDVTLQTATPWRESGVGRGEDTTIAGNAGTHLPSRSL